MYWFGFLIVVALVVVVVAGISFMPYLPSEEVYIPQSHVINLTDGISSGEVP